MGKFSQRYDSLQRYDLEIIGIPAYKKFVKPPAEAITLSVNASGFELLFNQIFRKKIQLDFGKVLIKNEEKHVLLKSNQRNFIQKQLGPETKMQSIQNDSIFLYLSTFRIKKVPVVVDAQVSFQKGFHYSKKHSTSPDSIEISGPYSVLKDIKTLKTNRFQIQNLDQTTTFQTSIHTSDLPKSVNLSETKVNVFLPVEQFTEGQFEIPIELLNVPKDVNITVFPQKVKVIFNVGMQHFKKLDIDQFAVVCDYEKRIEKDRFFLNPEIKKSPLFVKGLRVVPSQIEYLIVK